MTDIRSVLAENMKQYRKACGLSQEGLAKSVSSATGYIGMIERGKQFPSPQMLDRLAEALHIDTPDLFVKQAVPLTSAKQLYHELLTDFEKLLTEKINRLDCNEPGLAVRPHGQ